MSELTQQQLSNNNAGGYPAPDRQPALNSPTLAESVQKAVDNYFHGMEGQEVRELYELVLSEVEVPLLECVLRQTNHNQSQTALILGLNRGTLRKKLKKYGLL